MNRKADTQDRADRATFFFDSNDFSDDQLLGSRCASLRLRFEGWKSKKIME